MNSIISKFSELPRISNTWRILYSGLIFLLGGLIIKIINLIPVGVDKHISQTMGKFYWLDLIIPSILLIQFIILLYSIRIGINSYKKGERSWVLWIGFIPTFVLILLYWSPFIYELFKMIFYPFVALF